MITIDNICMNNVLLASASEVFETMIFMDLEQCFDTEQQIKDDTLLSSITFKGDLDGCLTICCSSDCAKSIGINMLGMDPEENISLEDTYDALGEVANMVMGSIKTKIQQNTANISVSIPMVVSGKNIVTNLSDSSAIKTLVKVTIDSQYIAEFCLLYKHNTL
ncbi:MAG: chemotaxis protein CheX [Sedimentisphaerales bacterium]|nr:chemotaxis protein CheX [Sedimentisphaerales bacterium]